MDLQDMKTLWQTNTEVPASTTALQQMIGKRSHPVLRKIKIQLLMEIAMWILVICFYYTAFDGDKRPAAVNLVFVVGLLQAIAYNLTGYFAARNLIQGPNIETSLQTYIKKLRKFRWAAVISRTVLMGAILFFFSYALDFNSRRLISAGMILLIFVLQLWLIYRSWTKRISRLSEIATSFEASA